MISGGGVAGLPLGLWLERFGFEPVVIDRANRFEALGNRVAARALEEATAEVIALKTR